MPFRECLFSTDRPLSSLSLDRCSHFVYCRNYVDKLLFRIIHEKSRFILHKMQPSKHLSFSTIVKDASHNSLLFIFCNKKRRLTDIIIICAVDFKIILTPVHIGVFITNTI